MYYVYPLYYYPACYHHASRSVRQYSSVDPDLFQQSANETKKIMNDANVIIDELAESQTFHEKLMQAAQASDQNEVNRLIHSLDIATEVDVSFNPDNLRLEFRSKTADTNLECCRLLIALRWR
ncbi:hypothetical protein KFZ56_08850 [Virgibacillus sp. NKC19-3]|uniref:hypothetical protein n=1 Tax=Virgibacillus saliphilus TaxID=2831674 RepID=UPI001C9B1D37|nr:hypothetical protein [Virgibacillus sp. NKC19-3]MBY7143164.1 hypothetical protein [Virgibacillus sp. NKC19-3]